MKKNAAGSAKKTTSKKKSGKGTLKPTKTPRTRKPANMSLEEWQIALRREFGREQEFIIKNLGSEPVFSEYAVTNPKSNKTYRVAIRGQKPGDNYCSCPDFAVNTLGTCKHIEFTVAKLEKKRGTKKIFEQGFHPTYSEIFLRYGTKRAVCFKPGTECPKKILQSAANFFDVDGVLIPESIDGFPAFLQKVTGDSHELRCYEDAIQFVAFLRDEKQRQKRIDELFPRGDVDKKFDHLLAVKLHSYQKKGALFAAKAGRCLIADDMGLGKTIQSIAATEILAKTEGIERVLVVTPTSVKHQWKQEIERFTKRSVEVVEGSVSKRENCFKTNTFFKIINYDVVHLDDNLINEWAPDVIILDEAQRIKNWKTRRAQSIKRLESKYAIVLTGTPLENRLEELHSIVEFVDRYRLGPLFRFLYSHQQADEDGMIVGYCNLSQISESLKPILIRRTKDEVLKELPERTDQHLFVPMTQEQLDIHHSSQEIVARLVAKWRRLGFLSEEDQRKLMMALQVMRMSCNSTYLIEPSTDHGVKADEFVALAEELLEEPNTKMVVFSQWLGTHHLIIKRLEARNIPYVFYNGSLSGVERNKIITHFKEDATCRIFLSTDAGGVGLNLQNASVIVNMDIPWNPAILEQRIGRIHRMGQHRPVRVVHYVSQGTIEHGMLQVLAFKKSVFAGVLDGGQDEVFMGKSRLKQFMETVENVSGGIPASMPVQEDIPKSDEGSFPAKEDSGFNQKEKDASREIPGMESQPWDELLNTGMNLINKLGEIFAQPESKSASQSINSTIPKMVAKDEQTGENYIKIPMPQPETLKKITEAIGVFASLLQSNFLKK